MVSSNGEVDEWLVEYFTSSVGFTSLDISSRQEYARQIGRWCGFLGERGLTWLDAIEMDFIDFKTRRTDQFLHKDAIGGAAWVKAVFAIRGLYDWATTRFDPASGKLLMAMHPVPDSKGSARVPGMSADADAVREMRDRWIVPGTYRLWREVGLRGRTVRRRGESWWEPGDDELSWKGRNSLRNTAFADLVYTSGLRVQEAGALLLPELHREGQVEAKLAAATAKYRKPRIWYGTEAGLNGARNYVRLTRPAAIRRAVREGRYERIADIVWVREVRRVRRGGGMEAVLRDGTCLGLAKLDPAFRRRMFWERDGRVEPMALWLTEFGTPFPHTSWTDVFDAANDRLFALIEALGGLARDELTVTPHSLRFSFALAMAVQLHRRLDLVNGWDERTPYGDGQRYEEVFHIIKDLLGHRSVETTRRQYLPRVRGVRFDRSFGAPEISMTVGDLVSDLAVDLVEVRDLTGPGRADG